MDSEPESSLPTKFEPQDATKSELVEKIFETLKEYEDPVDTLSRSSLATYMNLDPLRPFCEFLLNPTPVQTDHLSSRPKYKSRSKLPEYKTKMRDYISYWGYWFEKPAHLPRSILEATANYLEQNYVEPADL